MHGTLLDQRVFEALVARCLPMIHEHCQEVDVQLSVASLPWFLSLYVLSSPMLFLSANTELFQVHQQHAHGVRFPDSRLFLLHGTEGALSSRVSPYKSISSTSY